MKQTIQLKLPPELDGNANVGANFQDAMSTALRPVFAGIVEDAAGVTKYPFLASSYSIEEEPTGSGVIFRTRNTHPLFPFLDVDTRPHVITAKSGPYLVFEFQGHLVRVASVNHPGTHGEYAFRGAWGRGFPMLTEVGRSAHRSWAASYGASPSGGSA